jgi:hypothetical protein
MRLLLFKSNSLAFGLVAVAACSGNPPPGPCSSAPTSCPSSVPSFQHDVNAIIIAECLPCHDPATGQNQPPALNGYAAIAASAGQSLDQVNICKMPPPDAGFAILATDRQTLMTWYVCGAPNN